MSIECKNNPAKIWMSIECTYYPVRTQTHELNVAARIIGLSKITETHKYIIKPNNRDRYVIISEFKPL